MLDLSVAFDTVDHAILLDRLGYCYGLSEMVLRWMKSHLKDRPQCIALDKILLRQDICLVVFRMGRSLDRWYSRCISQ